MSKPILGLVLVALPGLATLAPAAQPRVVLRDLMTPAQFTSAGLSKLTATELAALETWLGTYTNAVLQVTASQQAQEAPVADGVATSRTPAVIESCIEGSFTGWQGETVFKLCNGQIWQQAEYAYTYHYAYRPEVLIYRSGGVYKMRVEDLEDVIAVKRLK